MNWNTKTGLKVLYIVTLLTCFANISCEDETNLVSQYSLASQPYSIGDTLTYVEVNSLDTQRFVVSNATHYFNVDEIYQSDAVIRTQNIDLYLSNIDKGSTGSISFYASNNQNDNTCYVQWGLPLDSTLYIFSASSYLYDYMDTATIHGKFYRKVKRDTSKFTNSDEFIEYIYSPVHGCMQITDSEKQSKYILIKP
jgi:hypothetical protein